MAAKPRVTCWAAATGITISALTSSSPTTRMATVTVTAAVTASSRFSSRTGRPGDPGELLVLADREQLPPQPERDREHERREHADGRDVLRRDGGERAEQVGA